MKDLHADAWRCVGGQWLHRPWFKVAANTLLRAVQPWPRKLVIYTRTVETEGSRPRAVGYGFGLVLHQRRT